MLSCKIFTNLFWSILDMSSFQICWLSTIHSAFPAILLKILFSVASPCGFQWFQSSICYICYHWFYYAFASFLWCSLFHTIPFIQFAILLVFITCILTYLLMSTDCHQIIEFLQLIQLFHHLLLFYVLKVPLQSLSFSLEQKYVISYKKWCETQC